MRAKGEKADERFCRALELVVRYCFGRLADDYECLRTMSCKGSIIA